jgi:hypothetical protein
MSDRRNADERQVTICEASLKFLSRWNIYRDGLYRPGCSAPLSTAGGGGRRFESRWYGIKLLICVVFKIGAKSNFEHVEVAIVDCPDLTKAPFGLTGSGLFRLH